MKEIGKTACRLDSESTNMLMVQHTMGNGVRTRNGDKAVKYGQTAIVSQVDMLKAKRKAPESSSGPMEVPTKAITMQIEWTVKELSRIRKAHTKVTGKWV